MPERSYGYRYTEQKGKTTAEIAKLMRRDIKQAITDGLLPGAPVKYSVRTDTFAGGAAIRIKVQDWPDAWQDCDGYAPGSENRVAGRGRDLCRDHFCAAKLALLGETKPGAQHHLTLTADARAAQMTLQRIHGAYNHDGSDSMTDYFDVNYYGSVEFESASSAAWRAEEEAKIAARRQETDKLAAKETRRVVVYGSKGKRTVHDAVDVDGRTRLVCGATLWRSSMLGDGAGRDLTCSRCAKRAATKATAENRRELFRYEIARRDTLKRSYLRISFAPGDDRTRQAIAAMFPNAWMFRLEGSSSWEKL